MLEKLKIGVSVLGFAFEVFSKIRQLIEVAEEHDTEDGQKNGDKKKKFVMDIAESIYQFIDDFVQLPMTEQNFKNFVNSITEAIVAFYNAVGWFRSLS